MATSGPEIEERWWTAAWIWLSHFVTNNPHKTVVLSIISVTWALATFGWSLYSGAEADRKLDQANQTIETLQAELREYRADIDQSFADTLNDPAVVTEFLWRQGRSSQRPPEFLREVSVADDSVLGAQLLNLGARPSDIGEDSRPSLGKVWVSHRRTYLFITSVWVGGRAGTIDTLSWFDPASGERGDLLTASGQFIQIEPDWTIEIGQGGLTVSNPGERCRFLIGSDAASLESFAVLERQGDVNFCEQAFQEANRAP